MNAPIGLILPSQQMLSSDIALITNIRLDSVKRTIERLAERRVITLPPKVEKPTAGRTSTEYVFSGEQGKVDSITVVAQLCPEFTAAIVKRWYELEQQTPAFDINNPQHLLQAIEVQAKQNLRLTAENKTLSQAIETITHTEHGVKFQQACKILNVKQQVLAEWLRKHNWDRYLNNARASTYYSESRGYCETKYSLKEGVKSSGQPYSYTQTEFFILPKGMQILAKRFGESL
ncbi:phage antirepressor KilAC domain-containing protein [Acinetobacter baumannii]|uniref:phage antirepressor KilAC domain-containing protein n=1 Tax=Acinetobacter baumannii TaxID=470 RepID=UPI002ABC1B36|nr:phage antirepressor KilAC domain-containing protein [Acinetobacter baumannii]MDZ3988872.1 phage antirepressor KilAC domain-containing protein [Acinetobacter baumannii]MDZ3998638.1 phage antirepressor KilAC domain-containing protein [Acinetobacter baumannii]MDZ4002219.1 phage antirepressor KilAC domain-containing protein [Acinetobacter baumannii]MDZ4006121.1 phage antirepressor KilAC domain-containing protein [Acinetobacter baumannii]MDZ4028421.1 phage antirepressor KilAC domain-containing p